MLLCTVFMIAVDSAHLRAVADSANSAGADERALAGVTGVFAEGSVHLRDPHTDQATPDQAITIPVVEVTADDDQEQEQVGLFAPLRKLLFWGDTPWQCYFFSYCEHAPGPSNAEIRDVIDPVLIAYADWAGSCAGSWVSLMTGCVPILGTAHGGVNMVTSIAQKKLEDECKVTTDGSTAICQDTKAVATLAAAAAGETAPLAKPGTFQNFLKGTGQAACAYGTMQTLMQIADTCKSGPGVRPKRWQPTCNEMLVGYAAFEKNDIAIPSGSLYTAAFLKLVDRPDMMICSLSGKTKSYLSRKKVISAKLAKSYLSRVGHECANKLIYIATQKRNRGMYRVLGRGGRQRRLIIQQVLNAIEVAQPEELEMTPNVLAMCTAAGAS